MSTAKYYQYQNKKYTLKELQKIARDKFKVKISIDLMRKRIYYGWKIADVVSKPVHGAGYYKYQGRQYSIAELVKLAKERYNLDLDQGTIYHRLKSGHSVTEAISKPATTVNRYQYEGQAYTARELSNLAYEKYHLKLTADQIRKRINYGASVAEAIQKPMAQTKTYRFEGHDYTNRELRQLAKERYNVDITSAQLIKRLKAGKTVEEAISETMSPRSSFLYKSKQYSANELSQIALRDFGVKISRIQLARRIKAGMPVRKAMSTPIKRGSYPTTFYYHGLEKTISEVLNTAIKQQEQGQLDDEMLAIVISINLQLLIKASSLSRVKVAKLARISESALCSMINNTRIPHLATLYHLGNVLGVTINDLINPQYCLQK